MKPVLSDLSLVFFHRSTKTMMMSSLYKTVSFFRPPSRRPDRSAGVTVRRRSVRRRRSARRRRSVRRRSVRRRRPGRRADRTAARHDRTGGPPQAVSPASEKKGRVPTETLPPICFMKEPVGNPAPGTPRSSPPLRHLIPPPTTLRALPLCFLTPHPHPRPVSTRKKLV
jgi:hypothetical protein